MHHPCVHLLCICMKNITLLKFWDKEVLNSEAYTLFLLHKRILVWELGAQITSVYDEY